MVQLATGCKATKAMWRVTIRGGEPHSRFKARLCKIRRKHGRRESPGYKEPHLVVSEERARLCTAAVVVECCVVCPQHAACRRGFDLRPVTFALIQLPSRCVVVRPSPRRKPPAQHAFADRCPSSEVVDKPSRWAQIRRTEPQGRGVRARRLDVRIAWWGRSRWRYAWPAAWPWRGAVLRAGVAGVDPRSVVVW